MAKAGVMFSKKDDWTTPKVIVDLFGKFDYDPATTAEKAAEFGIANYDTIKTDGLKADWTKYHRIWINPPFTKKTEFLAKAVATFAKTRASIYVLLPVEFFTTKACHRILHGWGGVMYLPNGRIKFEGGADMKATSPAFGSCVFKLEQISTIIVERFELPQIEKK
jgi:phage N-6-adenine-methyltransferase